MRLRLFILSLIMAAFLTCPATADVERASSDLMGVGLPFGIEDDVDFDICPQGARVVGIFLSAWSKNDYNVMYSLIDDGSKKGYPLEQARLDFQVLRFKPYKLSSIRRRGENFEFILSHGSWQDGDKDTKKMLISGKTFKVIMQAKNSPFKDSVEGYF